MSRLLHPSIASPQRSDLRSVFILGLSAVVWFVAYNAIQPLANWLTYDLFRLPAGSHLGESVAFFLYDVPKILLLLSGMIFLITVVRSFFSPEQTRAFLGGKREGVGNVMAAALGVVTPFCSCSAVPLFNEVALVMLFGLFGWKVAALYVLSGLIIAVLAGVVIGRLKLERYVADFVWQIKTGHGGGVDGKPTWTQRFEMAWQSTREIVGKVWLYVVIGIAVGAG